VRQLVRPKWHGPYPFWVVVKYQTVQNCAAKPTLILICATDFRYYSLNPTGFGSTWLLVLNPHFCWLNPVLDSFQWLNQHMWWWNAEFLLLNSHVLLVKQSRIFGELQVPRGLEDLRSFSSKGCSRQDLRWGRLDTMKLWENHGNYGKIMDIIWYNGIYSYISHGYHRNIETMGFIETMRMGNMSHGYSMKVAKFWGYKLWDLWDILQLSWHAELGGCL
jgi:hypothetical protein